MGPPSQRTVEHITIDSSSSPEQTNKKKRRTGAAAQEDEDDEVEIVEVAEPCFRPPSARIQAEALAEDLEITGGNVGRVSGSGKGARVRLI